MIKQIMKLYNKTLGIPLIPANSNKAHPPKPYSTWQVISKTSKDFGKATQRTLEEDKKNYKEVAEYREECTVQFDIYEGKDNNDFIYTRKLFELIIFILRKEYGFIDVGIKNFSQIKYLPEQVGNMYDVRGNFEVTFEYMNVTGERKGEMIEMIEYIINEYKEVVTNGGL